MLSLSNAPLFKHTIHMPTRPGRVSNILCGKRIRAPAGLNRSDWELGGGACGPNKINWQTEVGIVL